MERDTIRDIRRDAQVRRDLPCRQLVEAVPFAQEMSRAPAAVGVATPKTGHEDVARAGADREQGVIAADADVQEFNPQALRRRQLYRR